MPRSRSTIYKSIGDKTFPRPIKIGRGSFWRDDEIEDLIAAYVGGAAAHDLSVLCESFYERRRQR